MSRTALTMEELQEMEEIFGEGPKAEPVGAKPPKQVSYSHDAVIDLIIANPGASQGAIAAKMGYTQSWLSTVMSSDVFKARLAERRAEIVDPALVTTVKERMEALASRSVEVLLEKLAVPATSVPDNLALRAAELGAKSMGLGQPTFGGFTSGDARDNLDRLADRLVALQVNVNVGKGTESSLPPIEQDPS